MEHVHEDIAAQVDVWVVPGQPTEIRRLRLRNASSRSRRIEVTSYLEVVLQDRAAYGGHPAFSKLFVRTEFLPRSQSLLAHRRPRSADEEYPSLVHSVLGATVVEWETSRTAFVGRGAHLTTPQALTTDDRLSEASGNVLDPIASLRSVVELEAEGSAELHFMLAVAPNESRAVALADELARWTDPSATLAESLVAERTMATDLGLERAEADYLQTLAGRILYAHPGLRANREVLKRVRQSISGLAEFGISLDHGLAVIHVEQGDASQLLRVRRAHAYWRTLGLPIDILLLHDEDAVNGASLGEDAPSLMTRATSALTPYEFDLIHAAADLVVQDEWPDVATLVQLDDTNWEDAFALGPYLRETISHEMWDDPDGARESLRDFNGIGGFTPAGSEYMLLIDARGRARTLPPQPWINVIANTDFGFLISETGASTTWGGNSRLHRLTPWDNDPLLDLHGEALYLRDERTGHFGSPTPGPAPWPAEYEVRHGFGYSRFRCTAEHIEQDVLTFASVVDPYKVTSVRLTNRSSETRSLSLFAYYRLVLGSSSRETARFVSTELDLESRSVFARNRTANEFSSRVAFVTTLATEHARSSSFTCDRASFLGDTGDVARPRAVLDLDHLDGLAGSGLDPCVARQIMLELGPGETAQVDLLFGDAPTEAGARALLARIASAQAIEQAWSDVQASWRDQLSAIKLTSPSAALDRMVNGWLPYQTLSCRIWGRTAYYQSGGAFGFRDQLQDAASLTNLWPNLVKDQIRLHAAHQFVEGDVLHWWHPPSDAGIRTRFADDLLWLPYATLDYLATTGDESILDDVAPFLTARQLAPGEDEVYVLPETAGEVADVYEHCCRAMDRSLTRGSHGLPLFGTGDWNDGMNRVGREGKGESVWLGQFLYMVLGGFVPLCEKRGDGARAERYRAYRESLREALEDAWDGRWYRRGYYDDGSPLGSQSSEECKIDGLTQAWAVLSGAAPRERAVQGLASVEQHLISDEEGLIRLLTPPFANTSQDPGYIKGYGAGLRENGGQYTHAALWVVKALAELGRNDRVASLLEMLSPVHHTRTREDVARYQLEPYVIAADVYGVAPHVGRGGWSWYTGSAGWMFRIIVESLLGLRWQQGQALELAPCIPHEWPGFTLTYRLPQLDTVYDIRASNPGRRADVVVEATFDGDAIDVREGRCRIPILADGEKHRVELVLGAAHRDPAS